MKILFLHSLLITLLFSSCTMVEYEKSLPHDTPIIKEFPEELIGSYIHIVEDKNYEVKDTLTIEKYKFKFNDKKSDFVRIDETLNHKNIELKKFNDYYILNNQNKDTWEVLPLSYNNGKLIVYMVTFEEQQELYFISKLKEFTDVKEIINEGNSIDKYLINPSNSELDKMLKEKIFTEVMVFEKLK